MQRTEREFLSEMAAANFHRKGKKILKLFRVEDGFYKSLVDEVRELVTTHASSDVTDPAHATNWVNPFGKAVQYSLLNTTGNLTDTSTDHDLSVRGKRFHHAAEFPETDRFIRSFPHATNMRVNGLDPDSGLSPHEEHVVYRKGRRYWLRARLHLPILTNDRSEFLLDGDLYRMDPGFIYYFNNGCIHSATNNGESVRYHLVWDVRVTSGAFEMLFSDLPVEEPFLIKLMGADRSVTPTGRAEVGDYAISGRGAHLYEKLRLSRLRVKGSTFNDLYMTIAYARHRLVDNPEFAAIP